jgi:hypothetical protein
VARTHQALFWRVAVTYLSSAFPRPQFARAFGELDVFPIGGTPSPPLTGLLLLVFIIVLFFAFLG